MLQSFIFHFTFFIVLKAFTAEPVPLSDKSGTPEITIIIADQNEYERPSELIHDDLKNGKNFIFSQGFEIITDIDSVKVYISDKAVGRTPYENKDFPLGYYRVKLEKPGLKDFEFRVNVRKDKRSTVIIRYGDRSFSTGSASETHRISNGPLYKSFNPSDPFFYRQFQYEETLFSENNQDLLIIDRNNLPVITLFPESIQDKICLYTWDGKGADGKKRQDDHFSVINPENPESSINETFTLQDRFTRSASNYFCGYSGLALVPSGLIIFPGSLQFGSLFSAEFEQTKSHSLKNIPFSFFIRTSFLEKWEMAVESDISIRPENGTPSLQLNTSQKYQLSDSGPIHTSLAGRFSYRAAINDFSNLSGNALIRDPSGAALTLPIQFSLSLWNFYFSPEAIYYMHPILDDSSDNPDFSGAFRWGISYSQDIFSAGFSWAIYTASVNGSPLILQTAAEATLFTRNSPIYINACIIFQEIHKEKIEKDFSIGMGLGFLI